MIGSVGSIGGGVVKGVGALGGGIWEGVSGKNREKVKPVREEVSEDDEGKSTSADQGMQGGGGPGGERSFF